MEPDCLTPRMDEVEQETIRRIVAGDQHAYRVLMERHLPAVLRVTTRITGKEATPQLVKIYKESSDNGVKRAAVSGLFIARDATDLVELSRSEKDMSMKREIVSQLAVMHDPAATAYMEELLK